MAEQPLRILMVEDNPSDARLVLRELRQAGIVADVRQVDNEPAYLANLDPPPDVILCDYNLPQFGAPRALSLLRERLPHLPFLIVSGSIGEDTAVEVMRAGATDYLLKDRLGRLGGAVRQAVERHRLVQAEEKGRAILAEQARAIAVRASIATVVARGGEIHAMLGECCAALAWHAEALLADVWILDESGTMLEARDVPADGPWSRIPVGRFFIGTVAGERRSRLSNTITEEPGVSNPEWAVRERVTAFAGYPLIVEDRLVGVLALFSRSRVSRELFDHLGGVADLIAQLMERKRGEEALKASERRYRELADAIPQIVWTAGPDGALDHLNARAEEYSGLSRDSLTGWSWERVIHPVDLPATVADWTEIIRTGAPRALEFRIRRADGEYRWHMTRQVASRGPDRAVVRWYGTCTDIHDQKLAEEQVRQSGALLHAVAESTTDAVFVKDRQGRYLLFNPAASGFVGLPAKDVLGKTDEHVFDPASARLVMARDQQVMTEGAPDTSEEVLTAAGVTRTYLVTKSPYRNPAGEIIGLVGISRDVSDLKRAGEELRLRDRAIRAVSQGILITDSSQPDDPIIYASPSFEQLTGYTAAEAIGRNCRFLQGKDTDRGTVAVIREAIRERRAITVELLNYRKNGTPFWNNLAISPVLDGGEVTHFIAVQTDVTERRKLEEQLRQSQKMDAVGQLAGGVAHDFNNLLTVINGYAEILLDDPGVSGPDRSTLSEIRTAGERAAGLTAQLLAFSRKTVLAPKILDLNDVVDSIGKLLRRLIGEDVRFTTVLAPGLHRVKADPGLVEQVILNLAVNARDAMPNGGRLTIETKNTKLRAEDVPQFPGCQPGPHVRMSVTDTGTGMTEEVMTKIFEPFFTTKGAGKGTGLGLATVYGIVRQSGGHIGVFSEVGVGTCFEILFPGVPDAVISPAEAGIAPPSRGTETILLVEDEEGVRKLSRTALTLQGYTVLEASRGAEALRVAEGHEKPIHALVTDVVMPEMGGMQLAEALRLRRPDLRVLYVSGYTSDSIVRHGANEATEAFLQKPFTPLSLARKVRALLDGLR